MELLFKLKILKNITITNCVTHFSLSSLKIKPQRIFFKYVMILRIVPKLDNCKCQIRCKRYKTRVVYKRKIMDVLSRPAEEFGNDESLEVMWAMKAYDHAHIYFNILCSADPKLLKLTPIDDTIYKIFREEFPTLDLHVIEENELKSTKEKAKWRPFCERFKNLVEDYSFGTLVRGDASEDYKENNTILVTRIQFYAIEIARNKEGVNDILRDKFRSVDVETES